MAKQDNGKKLALGAIIGVVAGFITGILTAPKSGKETREDIKQTANSAKREAEKKLKELHSELGDLVAKGLKLAEQGGTKAKEELNQAIKAAQDAKEKVKLVISALKSGETDEPELKKAISDATKAKDHLAKFFKK